MQIRRDVMNTSVRNLLFLNLIILCSALTITASQENTPLRDKTKNCMNRVFCNKQRNLNAIHGGFWGFTACCYVLTGVVLYDGHLAVGSALTILLGSTLTGMTAGY